MKFVAGAFLAGALAAGVASAVESSGPQASREAARSRPTARVRPAPRLPRVPIATVAGSREDTSASLYQLRRSGKVVTATLRIHNDVDAEYGWVPDLSGDEGAWKSAEGLRLIDESNAREHHPLQDPNGECLCSDGIGGIARGKSIGVYAKFPAPPADVDRVSLHVPGFQSFDDIPLAP